jgi:hypothetical protein
MPYAFISVHHVTVKVTKVLDGHYVGASYLEVQYAYKTIVWQE